MPTSSWVNQPTTPHDSELMSLHTYLTGHGTMSHWTWLVLLLPLVHPLINQIRHLDPSSMDQVVHPCPWSDHTQPSLYKHTSTILVVHTNKYQPYSSPLLAVGSKRIGPYTPHGSSVSRTPMCLISGSDSWFTPWSNPTPNHDPSLITIQWTASNHHPTWMS